MYLKIFCYILAFFSQLQLNVGCLLFVTIENHFSVVFYSKTLYNLKHFWPCNIVVCFFTIKKCNVRPLNSFPFLIICEKQFSIPKLLPWFLYFSEIEIHLLPSTFLLCSPLFKRIILVRIVVRIFDACDVKSMMQWYS